MCSGVELSEVTQMSNSQALRKHVSIQLHQLRKETEMGTLQSFKMAGISMLLVAGLSACDKPGPAETAGKKIDQTAEAAGKKIEQTAEAAGKKITDTTDKVGDKLGEQGIKAGVVIDDAEITAKVKAAIFAEPGLKTLQISVDTIKSIVTLSGSVDTQLSSDRAKSLAGAVAGVTKVDNRLMTKIPQS
jgi:osmotically-inducible protein OsmY